MNRRPAALLAVGLPTVSLVASGAAPLLYAQVPVQIPQSSPATASLTDGAWLWVRTDYSDGSTIEASDPSKYTITLLPSGRVAIQADCNSGDAGYSLQGSRLTIQPAAMTLVACEPGSQDTVFVRDLMQVATYVFDGEQLVLNMRLDSGNMVFSPMPAASLTGGTWRVTAVNNGRGGVVSVLPGTEMTASFGADGNMSGDTGCNNYRAPYTTDGSTIGFDPIITTRRACLSDAATLQEQAFLAAISASGSYELVGDRLTLRDAAGATQLSLVRPTVEPPQ